MRSLVVAVDGGSDLVGLADRPAAAHREERCEVLKVVLSRFVDPSIPQNVLTRIGAADTRPSLTRHEEPAAPEGGCR
jgi:hypothetical protein